MVVLDSVGNYLCMSKNLQHVSQKLVHPRMHCSRHCLKPRTKLRMQVVTVHGLWRVQLYLESIPGFNQEKPFLSASLLFENLHKALKSF